MHKISAQSNAIVKSYRVNGRTAGRPATLTDFRVYSLFEYTKSNDNEQFRNLHLNLANDLFRIVGTIILACCSSIYRHYLLSTTWSRLPPRSNSHGRKRSFTEKNGDIRRSYTNTTHGHRIRCETVKNGFRIRRSCKNTE